MIWKGKNMKNEKPIMSVNRLGVGAVVLGLLASASVSEAQRAIINDLAGPNAGQLTSGPYESQDFSTTYGGLITSATVDLNFNAAAVTAGLVFDIYIYNATASGPTTPLPFFGLLGTVTPTVAGANNYTVHILNPLSVSAGQNYAVVIDTSLSGSQTVAWQYTTSANAATDNAGNLGAFLSGYTSPDLSTWSATAMTGNAFQLSVVPEPSTNACIGVGALALLAINKMRRKTA